jgi:hypothetical protein
MADELIDFFLIPMFWITTGLMISIVGNFLYLAFFDYILSNKLDPDGKIYGIIATSLDITEYTFFIVGFVCHLIWKKSK